MEKTIEDLAYLVKKAKDNNEPKPIVLLGAGASFSGNIPLANGIVKKILEHFKDKPAIKNLSKEDRNDYYTLMSALNPKERRELFKGYIKNAKINIAHIYLAQMVELGYIDYVLTVNFDDLLLRACGLFNYTMPVYDISNVDSFTNANLQKQSLVYLHGQHYGEWLLNSKGELNKGKEIIPSLISKISSEQTWIVVGYGGNDEVFDALNNTSSFQNDLYWVNYLDNKPCEKVQKNFIDDSTKNAHTISGYDADTFFLDLHAKLEIETPQIIDKPFSFLKYMMDEITVPKPKTESDEHKELYKNLDERKEISNEWVVKAINQIQEVDSLERFKQEIIEAIIKEEFNENEQRFLSKIKKSKFKAAKEELSGYFYNWANMISELAKLKGNEKIYEESFEKYKKATEINPKNSSAFNNWGVAIQNLAEQKGDEKLYEESFEKYKKATEISLKNDAAFNNWGVAIQRLAKQKGDEKIYEQSFRKYKKATEINPKNNSAFNNWGNSIQNLAEQKGDEKIYEQSFRKYKKATEINPKDYSAFFNWGYAIHKLAKQKGDEKLYEESFEKYKKATEINPKNNSAFFNWGSGILNLVHLTKNTDLLQQAESVSKKAYLLGGNPYNLSCTYAMMGKKKEALFFLNETLEKELISREDIIEDQDWKEYLEDEDFKELLAKY